MHIVMYNAMSCEKTAEPVKMQCGMVSRVGLGSM